MMTIVVAVLTYVVLFALLLVIPLERSALIEFGHPKE